MAMFKIKKYLRSHCKIIVFISINITLYICGVFTWLLEKNYSEYVTKVNKDIPLYINQWLNNELPPESFNNNYNYNYIHNCEKKCIMVEEPLRLIFLIKSSTRHFERREGIRNSWGFEKRFSDVEIRTVFLLGVDLDEEIQRKINEESKTKGDIVQANFHDTYYNNTIKTMMGLKWVIQYCNYAKFYFFSDDDMYVSTKNVLRFVRNPLEYPGYLEVPVGNPYHIGKKDNKGFTSGKSSSKVLDIELKNDTELYAGLVCKTRPLRQMFSKWYVPLSEYPYNAWPPYITAGAYVLSFRALKKLYYASMYVQHFRFDDIYLSMLSVAANVFPLHNSEFYMYKKSYDPYGYRYVIASHGYENPDELRWVWNDQKASGNA